MIDKEKAISYLEWIRPKNPYTLDRKNVQAAIDMAIEALKERPHGEWSGEPERRKMVTRVCTACGERSVVGYYCMWCGADMGYSPSKECSPSEECKKRGDQVVDWFLQGFNEAMEAKEGEKLENDRRGIPGIQETDKKSE